MIAEELIRGSTIMVVDDYDMDRVLFQSIIEKLGYKVLVATSGREALKLLADNVTVAMLITDINMPDLNGIDLLKHVRYARPHLPVLVLTARIENDYAEELGELEVKQVMQKPVDRDTLASAITEGLQGDYYDSPLLDHLRTSMLEAMNQQDPALTVTPSNQAYVRFGPELSGNLSVVVGICGEQLRASVVFTGPTVWWNRLVKGVFQKDIPSAKALFDSAGEFGNMVSTRIREYFMRRGLDSMQTPQLVFRGQRVELLSQYPQPILTVPFTALGMTEPFYLEIQIAQKGEESEVEVEMQDQGSIDLF